MVIHYYDDEFHFHLQHAFVSGREIMRLARIKPPDSLPLYPYGINIHESR